MKLFVFVLASALLLETVSSQPIALKTCEDVLSIEACTKLRNIAKIFHEKVGIVNEAVQAAIGKHINTTKEILIFAKNYLVDKANNFKCENVLSEAQCSKLTDLASKFHVSTANLTRDIKEAIADGITKGKELYSKTLDIVLSKLKNFQCEDLASAETCQKIRDFGEKIHATTQDISKAIIDAYSEGLENTKDFLKDVKNKLVNEISCEKVLSSSICSKLQRMADIFGASFDKIVNVLKESVSNGVTKISDLYKRAVKYIMDKWMGNLSYRVKRSLLDEMLGEINDMVFEDMAFTFNADKINTVAEAVQKIDISSWINDEIIALIETAVNKVFGPELRTKIDNWIEKHKTIVVEALRYGAKALYELIKSHWSDIIGIFGDEPKNDMLEVDDILPFPKIPEFSIDSWINDEIIALIEKAVNKVFGPELRTKIDNWIEKHKDIVIKAVKSGVEALYELIKQHWNDIIGIFGDEPQELSFAYNGEKLLTVAEEIHNDLY